MPYIEKRGDNYRIVFHLDGKRYRHALKTSDESVANSVIGGVERTIMLIEQRALQIPEGADVGAFILSGGKVAKPLIAETPDEAAKLQPVTLEHLRDKYVETMSIGAIEKNSLETVEMHLRHFVRTLGPKFDLRGTALNDLQEHVNKRAKAKGTRDEAHDHLKRALAEGKWKIVRGWHLFRHCFISLCVTKGIDQRLIDSWVGHTTEEMRKRYSHLYPSAEKQAIQAVFGS